MCEAKALKKRIVNSKMPRSYHAVKYCFLSPIHGNGNGNESDRMKWNAKK